MLDMDVDCELKVGNPQCRVQGVRDAESIFGNQAVLSVCVGV